MKSFPCFAAILSLAATQCGRINRATLDSNFNATGKVTTDFSSSTDGAYAVLVQSDQKIIALGRTVGSSGSDFALARYLTTGTLDTSFGTSGKATLDLGGTDEIRAATLQPDGKIVAAGTTSTAGITSFALARFAAEGTPDTGFGVAGKVTTQIGSNLDEIFAMVLQSDGKILVAGSTKASTTQVAVLRYNANGALDTAFGTSGRTVFAIGALEDKAKSIALHADGRILVGGTTKTSTSSDFFVARLLSTGVLDTTFGTSGKTTVDFSSDINVSNSADELAELAVLADEKILVAGSSREGTTGKHAYARVGTNGGLDITFATAGKATVDLKAGTSTLDATPRALKVLRDGTFLIAGSVTSAGIVDMSVSRYTSVGALDTSFGSNGTFTIDFSSQADEANAIALQADGKIVLAGQAFVSTPDFGVARYVP